MRVKTNGSKDESNIFCYAEILADITIWGCGQINRFDSAIFVCMSQTKACIPVGIYLCCWY